MGNLVQASAATPLVTITQIRPIFVSFTVPQDSLDAIRKNAAVEPLEADAYGNDDTVKLSTGKLTLIDNQIDPTTGTIHLKATFPNADERLWPGQFVNSRLVLSTRKNALTVPAQTVMRGAAGEYVFVIQPDSTVQKRDVTTAATQDGIAVIEKGVTAGEKVVVEGQYRLTNGGKVNTNPPKQQQPPAAG
jgi:multidrug efflux system membrane fusion protein